MPASIVFRTAGAWGAGKGADLTPAEVDTNFYELKTLAEFIESNPLAPTEISNIVQTGSQITIYMEDSTSFGPFTLPTARITWRGEWTPDTVYTRAEVFRVSGVGIYFVLIEHTSDATFDPDEINATDPRYDLMLAEPGSAAVKTVATATYEPILSDAGKYIRCTNVAGCVVTIPSNAEVAFPDYTEIHWRQASTAGPISFETATGVTLEGINGFADETAGPGAVATTKLVAADAWDLFGFLQEITA